jgi:serine/tyrosine/threonine adenylyltransferase
LCCFGRFEPLPGNLPQPLALRYHGHQFRTYNPDLGDGRGFLFAQLRDLPTAACSTSAPRAAAARPGRAPAMAA